MQAARAEHNSNECILAIHERTVRRNAMTLVELLLVLVLLVVVGSLSAPLFEGSFSSVRLRRGTDQVLAAWSEARTRAIEAGSIYQFRFKPEGNTYRVERWLGGMESDPLLESTLGVGGLADESPDAETVANSTGITTAEAELLSWTLEETLPEQITFGSAKSVTKDELGQRQIAQLDQGAAAEWSAPILFFPDGMTSSATLLLKNSQDVFCRATLRSLTGIGRASELLARDEVDQLGTP